VSAVNVRSWFDSEPGVSNIPGPVGPQVNVASVENRVTAGADSVVPGPVGERGLEGQQGIQDEFVTR